MRANAPGGAEPMGGDRRRELESLGWHASFDDMPELVALLDPEFRIVRVNRALADFVRRPSGELTGARCFELLHGREDPWPGCPHQKMLQSGRASTAEVDDSRIGAPLLVTASPVRDRAGDMIGALHVCRDVSALQGARQALEARNHELSTLAAVAREAQRSLEIPRVAHAALAGLQAAVGPDLALFYLREGDDLVLAGALPEDAGGLNERKAVGECLCGLAARDGTAVISVDIRADGRCTLEECKRAGHRSFAALPLVVDGETLGVLGVASTAERDFGEQVEFLGTLAATVTAATRNALLHRRLREQAADLERRVEERTAELAGKNADLERFNRLFVDREFRIKELRDRVRELEEGRPGG